MSARPERHRREAIGESDAPYLSVVATARNDNHGGDLLYRIQIFVDALVAQCERHGISAELVLVEWNPPPDRPPLAEVLDLPVSERCPIRIIEVPHELHAALDNADRLPLFQMIAKNAGIRRARGRFVLATNVDVILSDELAHAIGRRRLARDVLYRCDRYDVTSDIPLDASVETQLDLCAQRVIRINTLESTVDLRTGAVYPIYRRELPDRLPLTIAVAFRALDAAWRRIRSAAGRTAKLPRGPVSRAIAWARAGGARKLMQRWRAVTWRLPRLRMRRPAPRRSHRPDGHMIVGLWQIAVGLVQSNRLRLQQTIELTREAWEWERSRLRLFTNASGDFTLMSAEGWARLHGYPELQIFSMHLDGLMLYQAHYAGLAERTLPGPIYHLEHESGFRPDTVAVKKLNDRLERAALPQVTMEQFRHWAMTMYETQAPIEFNPADWGFAEVTLSEVSTFAPVVSGRAES